MATLEELRAKKAAREAAEAEKEELRELEELQLEDDFSTKLGKRGVDFEIVNTVKGCFVLKKPDFVTAKRFTSVENRTDEDVIGFVSPCVVHPDTTAFRSVIVEHGGIAYRCASALLTMYEARAKEKGKKY